MKRWQTLLISALVAAAFILAAVLAVFLLRRRRRKPSHPHNSALSLSAHPGRSRFVRRTPDRTQPLTVHVSARGAAVLGQPLPGPQPGEAYFEVTVVAMQRRRGRKGRRESGGVEDKSRLVREDGEGEKKGREEDDGVCVVGLQEGRGGGGFLPGRFAGSIGFCSDGRLDLEGTNLALESEKTRWGAENSVVGCGFNPTKKTVFFTVDAALVHLVRCHSDPFSRPLFPIIASTADVTVTVNLGQRPFKYLPANLPPSSSLSSSLSMQLAETDYSEELFSVGRTGDSLRFPGSRKSALDRSFDESDLFEISIK